MKTNIESRYLFLKRFIAYYPSTIFLRTSILKIAKQDELITLKKILYTTNKVFIFLLISSYIIFTIESIYFFVTNNNESLKIHYNSFLDILGLEFNLLLFVNSILHTFLQFTKKKLFFFSKIFSKFSILIKYISMKSIFSFLKVFFLRVSKNAMNIFFITMTVFAFVLDKFLESIEIRWFYRSLPITKGSPFFFA